MSTLPTDFPYTISGDLPLQIEPASSDDEARSVERLCKRLEQGAEWVQEALTRHGALRFRDFSVTSPLDFERVARAIDPELGNDYLGTSPRDRVTDYVFNASELPDYYPIPQHCEMSFCATPPRRVFFNCQVEPAPGGGETPLCDFRRVWQELDPVVRDRFVEKGLRIVRNYGPPGQASDDPTQLKPWDEMFLTRDRAEVERQCEREGFEAIWLDGDGLRLVSTQPVYRDHPVTGERVWHNHLTTFHVGAPAAELRRIARMRPSERHRGLVAMAEQLEARLRERAPDERGMHTTHRDGSEIDEHDVEAVRDAVWKHLVVDPWKYGDVVAIDNHSVSHGRLPYEGERSVVVCWA